MTFHLGGSDRAEDLTDELAGTHLDEHLSPASSICIIVYHVCKEIRSHVYVTQTRQPPLKLQAGSRMCSSCPSLRPMNSANNAHLPPLIRKDGR
jgi:hypothetical protein